MKYRVLSALLLLSVLGNVFLLIISGEDQKSTGAVIVEPDRPEPRGRAPADAASEAVLPTRVEGRKFVSFAETLRSAGFPEEMIERLAVGAVLVAWGERRHRVKAEADRAIDIGNFAEADRLELEEFAWRKDAEAQLIALGVEVENTIPWLSFEQRMLPKEWPAETRWQLRWGDRELRLELEQQERARLYGQHMAEDMVNRFDELQMRMLTSVMEVLPPDEAFGYVIQYGLMAEDTRRDLRHVQMTDEEAGVFFRLTSEMFSRSMEGVGVSPEDLLLKFGEKYGAERAARLKMEQNHWFMAAADVTQRFGLPREIAEEVYRIEETRPESWTDLSPEDEALVAEKLGAEAYQAYRKHSVESRRSGVQGVW